MSDEQALCRAENDVQDSTGLQWSIHPARRRPFQAIAVSCFLFCTIALVHVSFRELFFTVLAALMLFLSLTTYFLPTRYEVDRNELRIQYPFSRRQEPLAKFRALIPDRNGFLLSTVSRPGLAHELRGIFLVVPREERERVRAWLAECLNKE